MDNVRFPIVLIILGRRLSTGRDYGKGLNNYWSHVDYESCNMTVESQCKMQCDCTFIVVLFVEI